MEDSEKILCELLLIELRKTGILSGEGPTLNDIKSKIGFDSKYDRWLEETLRVLEGYNLISMENGLPIDKSGLNDGDSEILWYQWEEAIATIETESQKNLVRIMVENLSDILVQRVLATDIMFPNSSFELVEGIYKENEMADYCNNVVTEVVEKKIKELIEDNSSRKINIFEVGAGTGGTSQAVFKKLQAYKKYISEYCYTDISRAFLVEAENKFKANNEYLNCQLYNVEEPDYNKDIKYGEYDIVLATNVLHATKNIHTTMANIKTLLNKGGIIVINEVVKKLLFTHLTFGLLDGWWRFDDPEVRIQGSPCLSVERWKNVLQQEGYQEVSYPMGLEKNWDQGVIVAISDGNASAQAQAAIAKREEVELPKPEKKVSIISRSRGGDLFSEVRDNLLDNVSNALKISKDRIEVTEAFSNYGVDSIIGVSLVNEINDSLGIDLQTTDIFDYGCIKDLTKYIVENYKDKLKQVKEEYIEPVKEKIAEVVHNREAKRISLNFKKEVGINIKGNTIEEEDIAIIGMSGRFPKSGNVDELWDNLAQGRDLVQAIDRWDISKYLEEGETVCNYGSYLEDIDKFDPLFFNISGQEATYMDPDQRLFLQESWKILEDAGYAGDMIKGKKCGVYVGCGAGDYQALFKKVAPPQSFWGNTDSIVPARISYYLNLKGPAIAIDTACSSSLVAMHLACQSLRTKECDMAIAGGVFVQCEPRFHISCDRANMLSKKGRCYTFDDRADGIVLGEGVGGVLLKRLSEAIKDRDHIYGVIKASGVNQDGTTNGITAPSLVSQKRLEIETYKRYNINPENIQMIEAHGTGTKLGDPIEYEALSQAFKEFTDKRDFCVIGSIKTNLGHGVTSAGIAGVIKILLSMKNKQIPPIVHFEKGNENIKFDDSPFYLNHSLKEWEVKDKAKRCAAISGFGFSGTNAHIVIEEAPEEKRNHIERNGYLVLLSARNKEQLKQQVMQLNEYCMNHKETDLGNMCFTLTVGRKYLNNRFATVVESIEDFIEVSNEWLEKGKSNRVSIGTVNTTTLREQPSLRKYGIKCIEQCSEVDIDELDYIEKLQLISELFVQGYELEYNELFAKDTYLRISLPTYPFAKDSYWVRYDDLPEEKKKGQIHPLLHENVSIINQQSFSSTFTGKEHFLTDHQVEGKKILPGVAYIEMVRTAVENSMAEITNKRIQIKELIWMKPIIVDKQAVDIKVDINSEAAGDYSFKVYEKNKNTVFCKGLITIINDSKQMRVDINSIRNEIGNNTLDAKVIYDTYEKVGIKYGESHQGIEEMYLGDNCALVKLKLPSCVRSNKEQFVLHPSILDSAMQAYVGIEISKDGNQAIALPYAVETVDIYNKCNDDGWALVEVQEQGNLKKMRITIVNQMGQIGAILDGVTFKQIGKGQNGTSTKEKVKTQNTEIKQDETKEKTLILTPQWEISHVDNNEITPSVDENLLVICNEQVDITHIQEKYSHISKILVQPNESEESIRRKLEEVGQIKHILWALKTPEISAVSDERIIDEQEVGIIYLFRMIKALIELGYGVKHLSWTILTEKSEGVLHNDIVNPVHASIHGFIGSLAKEYPIWKMRIVDIEDVNNWDVNKIFSLPFNIDGDGIAIRKGVTYTSQLVPTKLTRQNIQSKYKKDGVYVVIGGAGGIGVEWSNI